MNTNKLSVYAVGDIRIDHPNPKSLFELALPTLKQADILLGQLGFPLTDKGELQTCCYPRMDGRNDRPVSPEKVSALTYAGFDVMSQASDHYLDRGYAAFLETIDTVVTKNNIQLVGVGRNIDEARKPVILERKGTKVGFLDYCSVCPGVSRPTRISQAAPQ